MGWHGEGGRQQSGDFLDEHASPCSWSSVWLLSLLVQRAGSIGLLSLLGQASPARWCPTQAAGKQGPTLPVPTASVRVFQEAGEGRVFSRQAPIYVPQRRAAQLGDEAGEGTAVLKTCSALCLHPSLPTSSPSELELSRGLLWPRSSSSRPSTSLPHPRAFVRAVP